MLAPKIFLRRIAVFNYSLWLLLFFIVLLLAGLMGLWILIVFCLCLLLFVVLVSGCFYRMIKKWSLQLVERNSKKLGQYTCEEILDLVQEAAGKMDVRPPRRIYLYRSKLPNAFAIKLQFLFSKYRNSLGLYLNILHILNKEELVAVIGHELAHIRFGRMPFPAIFLLGPKLTYKVLQANEHLADYYSALFNGLLPMVNCLLKVYSRAQIVEDILKYLDYFTKTYDIPDEAIPHFFSLIEERVPHIVQGDEQISHYGTLVMQKYISQRGGSIKSVARRIAKDTDRTIKKVMRSREWEKQYEKVDWQMFDNHIRDMWIDVVELKQMYSKLKQNEKYRLFLGSSKDRDERKAHPFLRDRIIFLVESLSEMGKKKRGQS